MRRFISVFIVLYAFFSFILFYTYPNPYRYYLLVNSYQYLSKYANKDIIINSPAYPIWNKEAGKINNCLKQYDKVNYVYSSNNPRSIISVILLIYYSNEYYHGNIFRSDDVKWFEGEYYIEVLSSAKISENDPEARTAIFRYINKNKTEVCQ